nr:hypothetical protein [Gardnerella vaginalis]
MRFLEPAGVKDGANDGADSGVKDGAKDFADGLDLDIVASGDFFAFLPRFGVKLGGIFACDESLLCEGVKLGGLSPLSE